MSIRKIRIIVSTVIVIGIVALIFIATSKNIAALQTILYTQIAPNITSIFAGVFFIMLPLFILLSLTIFFGRVYCSFICPLGTFQDAILGIRKIIKNKKFSYSKEYIVIRYAVFAITVFSILFGSYFALSLFEPFSVFVRTISLFLNPLKSYVYYISGGKLVFTIMPVSIIAISAATLVLIIVMTVLRGRLYCNTLCPVGSLLSIIEPYSKNKIVIDETCTKCKRCEKVCKAECIDSANAIVDNHRCVMCGNCLSLKCEHIKYTTEIKENTNERKKMLIATGGALLSGILGIAGKKLYKNENKYSPILPPGSLNNARFASRCTSCYTCVISCPTKVITPSIVNKMRPEMKYIKGYCEYECKLCSDVCPSNAISKMSVDEKKRTQIGRAVFKREDCIVVLNKEDCGACSEHCPTKALTNVVDSEGLLVPKTNDSICIGCGACENVCPAKTKAIYVLSLERQTVISPATLIKEQGASEGLEINNDFPF